MQPGKVKHRFLPLLVHCLKYLSFLLFFFWFGIEFAGSTLGEIVNLVSVDSHRFVDLAPFINELWSAPLTLLISLYFLWNTLGASVLGGLAVMILLVPLNIFIQKQNKQLVLRQMEAKDDRVKLMNEVLSGIKVRN